MLNTKTPNNSVIKKLNLAKVFYSIPPLQFGYFYCILFSAACQLFFKKGMKQNASFPFLFIFKVKHRKLGSVAQVQFI